MGKPLLTDDIIEQAKRGEIDLEEHPYYEDYDQEFYDEDCQPSAYKSRRIENAKRNQFQHKLNRILFWVVVLLILLFIAVFYF